MSLTYLFFAPARLPLTTDMLDEAVRPFTNLASVRATLGAHLPHLAWHASPEGALASGTVAEGDALYELHVSVSETPAAPDVPADTAGAPPLMVSLQSSGRVDSASFVQRLCDATGWVAFDERPRCFQPHHPPIPA